MPLPTLQQPKRPEHNALLQTLSLWGGGCKSGPSALQPLWLTLWLENAACEAGEADLHGVLSPDCTRNPGVLKECRPTPRQANQDFWTAAGTLVCFFCFVREAPRAPRPDV